MRPQTALFPLMKIPPVSAFTNLPSSALLRFPFITASFFPQPSPNPQIPISLFLSLSLYLSPSLSISSSMGNYLTCSLASPAVGLQSGPKVILPSGDIRHLSGASATAAELMLEHPGFFLVHSSAILINRRLFALSADEELELGVVYGMFPMDRVGSTASAADMGRLLLASGKKAIRDRVQATPAAESTLLASSSPPSAENLLKLDEMDDGLVPEFMYKRSLCRSRRQALETITEEAVF